jgi:hypothetical protein
VVPGKELMFKTNTERKKESKKERKKVRNNAWKRSRLAESTFRTIRLI